MWETRGLTTLEASTASYMESFTFILTAITYIYGLFYDIM
jgi:hypothetical protein